MVFEGEWTVNEKSRVNALCAAAAKNFTSSDWQVLAAQTGTTDLVSNHGRLFQSLRFGDDDYEGNAYTVLTQVIRNAPENLGIVEGFIADRYGLEGINVSTAPSRSKPIVFTPNAFETPEGNVEPDLVAVMMPFAPQFEAVFGAIKDASTASGLRPQRVKDIWHHSVLIQDVFSLIYRSQVVICDFTGKNPNVFYECGIAHTLGKHVIPITQSGGDVPFDLQHHRYLHYLPNGEGLDALRRDLLARFNSLNLVASTKRFGFPGPSFA